MHTSSPYKNIGNGPTLKTAVDAIDKMSGPDTAKAKKLGISVSTINKWRRKVSAGMGSHQLIGTMRQIIVSLKCDQLNVVAA